MHRSTALVVLPLRFVWAVVTSGLQTTRTIVHLRPARPRPAFAQVRFAPLTPTGAALLGCFVTLTPGTTVIDIDPLRGVLRLHLLDRDRLASTVVSIRRDFEPALQAWFGRPAR